ncbi:MAG: 50S ribosomal protein L9 [Candidatus Marinimicrobia bacterium]|jgi:large subunit ribosomal protein L9|nr:50S ribosomal protein L9 [Candidatus Neomarinimicrobiota bacterium]MDP7060598.1 50S ribosomal protein L9 [Candidatus Neomarinimicrobiota bacterium]|tara:strand:+ start:1273 stop:1716 length:444 start_codon:yes stop_codon:yes gene_type:complete
MEVILKQKIDKLGDVGDMVRVKDGYARNYLMPRGLVVEATPGNVKEVEELKNQISARDIKTTVHHGEVAEQLSKLKLSAPVKVGEDDRLFGSVTAITISELLQEQGFDVDRKAIQLDEPIKSLGVHNISIKLHTDVETEIKVYVIKE